MAIAEAKRNLKKQKSNPEAFPYDEFKQAKRNLAKCSKRNAILENTFKMYHKHIKSNPNTCMCGRHPCLQLQALDEAEALLNAR